MTKGGFARARVIAAVLAAAVLVATGWLTAASLGVEAAGAAGQQSYSDPIGDAGFAADVVSVNVSNDDVARITVKVQFSNRPSALGNEGITVYLDTDLNPSNNASGYDYRLRYYGSAPDPKYAVERWNATSAVWETGPQGSFAGSYAPATQELVFAIDNADLGGTTAFRFYVFTAVSGHTDVDYAPDTDPKYRYDLQLPPPPSTSTAVPPPPPPPVNTTAPAISGPPEVARELKTTTGDWSGREPIVFQLQWLRCNAAGEACGAVAGRTAATYVVRRADLGSTLRVAVTARNSDGTATATSAQTRLVHEQPDTDRDGVPDAIDQCDRKRAGRFDFDHDGCPGPFQRIHPRSTSVAEIAGGFLRFTTFRLDRLPKGSSVVLRGPGIRLHARASAAGLTTHSLANTRLKLATILTLQVTKAGWIGYWAKLRVNGTDPTLTEVRVRCIPAVGATHPVPCKRVDRGR